MELQVGLDEEKLQGETPETDLWDQRAGDLAVTAGPGLSDSYLRTVKVEAATEEEVNELIFDQSVASADANYIVIFGDSQAQNEAMGQTLEQKLETADDDGMAYRVTRVANAGKSIEWYANGNSGDLKRALEGHPGEIFVFLGGNGTAESSKQYVKPLLDLIFSLSPGSYIQWILPPPPANHKLYRKEGGREGTGTGDYEERKIKSETIKQAINDSGSPQVESVYDIYALSDFKKQDNGIWNEPWGNPQTVDDGIHVKGEMREKVLSELGIVT